MDNKLLALLIAASVALAGCNGESDDLPPGKLSMSNFKKNRSKWESLQVDDYQMHYRLACFCLDDATSQRLVKVTGNQLDSAVNADTNAALLGETYETLTIDELFGRIALEESRADKLYVEYDATYGYPTKISVDGNEQMADDEYTITVSDVKFVNDVTCTTEIQPGLLLTVVDNISQSAIGCGVTVTAEEGSYSETVMNSESDCMVEAPIAMLAERPGFYTLTISSDGYQTLTLDNVGVGADLCHVITREITIGLTPE